MKKTVSSKKPKRGTDELQSEYRLDYRKARPNRSRRATRKAVASLCSIRTSLKCSRRPQR